MIEVKDTPNDPLHFCKQCAMCGFCKSEEFIKETFKDIVVPANLKIICNTFNDIGRHR